MPAADDSSSSDDDDANLSPEALERRQRALQLLAKALNKGSADAAAGDGANGKGGAAAASHGDADAEVKFLQSLMKTPPKEILRCVRDRLSVLSVTKGDVQVSATKKKAGPTGGAAAAQVEEKAEPRQAAQRLPDLLKRLSDGDAGAVSPRILAPEYWEALVRERVSAAVSPAALAALSTAMAEADAAAAAAAPAGAHESGGLAIPNADLGTMRQSLDERGYGALQPGAAWDWSSLAPLLEAMYEAAAALRAAGWPPAFVFALPGAWKVIDRLFIPMEALLGEGCEMDPSVFCWIAHRPAPLNAPSTAGSTATNGGSGSAPDAASAATAQPEPKKKPAAGANFGVPHRDFTCLQSLRKSDGAPNLLSIWLPLCAVTTENGCMMVVPKPLDRHFHKRWAYAHMRPALPPDEEEGDNGATEVRFELAAARPLAPLAAGSIAAWVGNLIHWGTCCMPDTAAPTRTSVGFNFLRQGERLQSGAPSLSRAAARALSLPERLAIIARSLLAYSPWYALNDDAVPAAFFPDADEVALG